MSTLLDRAIAALERGNEVGDWVGSLVQRSPGRKVDKKEGARLATFLSHYQAIDAHSLERWCDGMRVEEAAKKIPSALPNVHRFAEQIVCAPPPFDETWIEYSAEPVDATPEEHEQAKGDSYGLALRSYWKRGQPGKVAGLLFYESAQFGIAIMGEGILVLDAEAKPNLEGFLAPYDNALVAREKGYMDEFIRNFRWGMTVAAMAFQLMDCPKEHVPRELVAPSRGLARKWRRKHGRELVSYYVLDVGPSPEEARRAQRMVDDARREGRAPPRLHWVRGHFKRGQHVTPERPQGRYCRPFLRGSMEAGLVLKDYNVRTPMAER